MNGIKPIDVVVAVALRHADTVRRARATSWLAEELAVSTRMSHESLKRLKALRLVTDANVPLLPPLMKFLAAGAAITFPVEAGPIAGGVPTASSAPPLTELFGKTEGELAFVWPDAEGELRGAAIEPLHRSVPNVARSLPGFYEDIALVDGLRIWNPRVRREAERMLAARFEEQ